MEVPKEKICSRCQLIKPIHEFRKRPDRKMGFTSWCKDCLRYACKRNYEKNIELRRQYGRAYYAEYVEERIDYRRRFYKENIDYIRQYYIQNKDRILNRQKIYAQENPEKIREIHRKSDNKYKERRLEARKLWRNRNPDKVAISVEKRRARKKNSPGSLSEEEWVEIKNKYGNKCLRCGRTDVKLTIDHVIPIYYGGASSADNIQPLCLPCNASKGTKTTDYR